MRKKLVSMFLVAAMAVTTFAGCGSSAEEETPAPSSQGGSAETEAGEDVAVQKFEETQHIKIKCMDIIPSDNTARDAAINKIAKEKLNVEVEIEQTDIVSYMNQLPLALSTGEKFDLVMFTAIPACGFTTMQAQNQLMDITEYVDDYAPDAKKGLGEYLDSTTVNGKVYGFPNYRQFDTGTYLMMRRDVLKGLGLEEKAKAATTWAQIEEIFAEVAPKLGEYGIADVFGSADNQGTMLTPGGTVSGGANLLDTLAFDALGDTYKVLITDQENDKVLNMFENDAYKEAVTRANDWYNKGWVRKSALSDRDNSGDTGMKNDMFFAHLATGEFGIEQVKINETGKDLMAVKLSAIPINTQSGRQWGWGVPSTSENPEAAVAFYNLMFSDPEIENLFAFGIEGDDYTVVDGEAHINYGKEGVYMSGDFLYPNQFNALPKQGMGADFRQKALEVMEKHPVSKYYGIAIDATPIADQITNVKTVLDKIQLPLEAGQLDPSQIEELNKECMDAGLQEILDFYQAEIDKFVAKK